MKKRKLKRWVKATLFGITSIVVMVALVNVLSIIDKQFINDCTNSGYSVNYCMNQR